MDDAHIKRQKITVVAIVALLALAVLFLLGLIIGNLIGKGSSKLSYTTLNQPSSGANYGALSVVNGTHAYTFPAEEDDLVDMFNYRDEHGGSGKYVLGTSMKLKSDAADAANRMLINFCNESGLANVNLYTAYRTADMQKTYSVPVGQSDHHTGYLFGLRFENSGDLFTKTDKTQWLLDNAAKYGLVQRYPEGKEDLTGVKDYTNVFRYVGVPHATYMKEHNLCLEEYIDLLHGYTQNGKHLKVTGVDGVSYEIYSQKVSDGETTALKVPSNKTYTVSGDNEGYFIVTVKLG